MIDNHTFSRGFILKILKQKLDGLGKDGQEKKKKGQKNKTHILYIFSLVDETPVDGLYFFLDKSYLIQKKFFFYQFYFKLLKWAFCMNKII